MRLNRFSVPNPERSEIRSRVGECALGGDSMKAYSGLLDPGQIGREPSFSAAREPERRGSGAFREPGGLEDV